MWIVIHEEGQGAAPLETAIYEFGDQFHAYRELERQSDLATRDRRQHLHRIMIAHVSEAYEIRGSGIKLI